MNAEDFFKEHGVLELVKAGEKGDTQKIMELVGRGVNINAVGEQGVTPLLWTLGVQKKISLKILLKHGANPDYIAPDGTSAVILASGANDPELLKILLEGGGNPNIKDKNGEPALFTAIYQVRMENIKLLLDFGADINLTNRNNETAALHAAILNKYEVVAYLISRGTDISVTTGQGVTLTSEVQDAFSHLDKTSENYKWLEKVAEMLKERGVNVLRSGLSGEGDAFSIGFK
ncbi:MAG: ankyrin repeat domain-containing protein [Nitrospirae bacterium]|nr:ankyrin repeat domain-containing protein [Nitrospirota bacterium]